MPFQKIPEVQRARSGGKPPRTKIAVSVLKMHGRDRLHTRIVFPKTALAQAGIKVGDRVDVYIGNGEDEGTLGVMKAEGGSLRVSKAALCGSILTQRIPATAPHSALDVEHEIRQNGIVIHMPKVTPVTTGSGFGG